MSGIGPISPNDWIVTGGSSPGEDEAMYEEMCVFCGEGSDSIYWLDGQIGPMCEQCNNQLHDEILADQDQDMEPLDGPDCDEPETDDLEE